MIKISEQWLRSWVNPALHADALADLMTQAGLEVDALTPVAGVFSGVIVAQVVDVHPHPNAERLKVCAVDTGKGSLVQVVCGAANVRAGLRVALAEIGAVLPHMTITRAKLRGEISEGMLCSASELGMQGESEGILELAHDAPVGVSLREYLHLDDIVFDIDLTPNRSDCLSVYGIAREVAALTGSTLASLPALTITWDNCNLPNAQSTFLPQVTVAEPAVCPQYIGCVIEQIDSDAVTPLWMQERLRRGGLRTVHPVVDITNYVMLEYGQPLHAFDLRAIAGNIEIRYAKPGESITLLNQDRVTILPETLCIADDKKILAMAGIMGSAETAVNVMTSSIFLECAYFTPERMAGKARAHALCTDASQRFERGVDISMLTFAARRALDLIQEITGGVVKNISCLESQECLPVVETIAFSPDTFAALVGMEIPFASMQSALCQLGMLVDSRAVPWQVTPPAYRCDIRYPVDLIEEILRVQGYDTLQGTPLWSIATPITQDPLQHRTRAVLHHLTARGYAEVITYSFIDHEVHQLLFPEETALALANPISSELSVMRTSLIPGLLAAMMHNTKRQCHDLKLLETGTVFAVTSSGIQEHMHIAGLLAGKTGGMNWPETERLYDFFDAKGDLESLLDCLSLQPVTFEKGEYACLHPGKSARLMQGEQCIGMLGVLHPEWVEALELDYEPIVFECALASLVSEKKLYRPISKYPQVRRDLALLMDCSTSAADVESLVRAVVDPTMLRAFYVFDIYTGDAIPQGKKSMAIALLFQDIAATLQDDVINSIIDNILNTLNNSFSITLRNQA